MNAKDLLRNIQEYYGEYTNKKVVSYVMAYIKADIQEKHLDKLLKYLLYYHPVNFGSPDIAAIEKCIKLAIDNGKGCDVRKAKGADAYEIQKSIEEKRNSVDTERAMSSEIIDLFKKKLKGGSK